MFGVIAWIRADGRKALVVVEGSPQMAAGDPGVPKGPSLSVGDLVFLPDLSQDMSDFGSGLKLVRGNYWPQIRREIGQMAVAKSRDNGGNVVNIFARNKGAPSNKRYRRHIAAAE